MFVILILFSSPLFLPSALKLPGLSATRARSHQPVHLQPASIYGRAGAGEHAEASRSRHLHKDTEGCQWCQQRSRLCQVRYDDPYVTVSRLSTHSSLLTGKHTFTLKKHLFDKSCLQEVESLKGDLFLSLTVHISVDVFVSFHACKWLCVCAYMPIIGCLCLCTHIHGYQQLSCCPYSISRAAVFPPPSLSLNCLFLFLLRKVSTPAC